MCFCVDITPGEGIFMKVIVCKAVSMAKLEFDHTKAE